VVRNKPSPSIPQASPLLYVVGLDATPTICPTVYMGWGGVGMFTFLRPRSLDLAQDLHAMLAWVGVGWGCSRSFDHIPSTLHKMFMLRSHGVGWGGVGMLTFLRPRSLALAKDVDAVLKWVRWGGALLRFTRPFARLWCCAQDHDAAYPWCWYIYIYMIHMIVKCWWWWRWSRRTVPDAGQMVGVDRMFTIPSHGWFMAWDLPTLFQFLNHD